MAYLDELDRSLQRVDTLIKTGNVTLDAIVSAKLAQAFVQAEAAAGALLAAAFLADAGRAFCDRVRGNFSRWPKPVAGEIGEGVDRACMRRAGLGRKLDSLPKGIDSRLDKQVNEDGVEVSGGETQKIALARALYKDAPLLVLDEPTAALDPIAENEIYLQYRDMTCGKTSLFISNRLASCRFCDEILVFHEGEIVQRGSHQALLAEPGGKYAELWHVQAQYYASAKED